MTAAVALRGALDSRPRTSARCQAFDVEALPTPSRSTRAAWRLDPPEGSTTMGGRRETFLHRVLPRGDDDVDPRQQRDLRHLGKR